MTTGTNQVAEMSAGGWSGRGTLTNLVAELQRQKESKIDFCADARTMGVQIGENGGLALAAHSHQTGEWLPQPLAIGEKALPQFGERVSPQIPTKFIKELAAERPARAADLITGLMHDQGKRNLVRCLGGRVRAFLSDRYRILDNYDTAFAALDVARSVGAEIIECSLTETSMRVKFVSRQIWAAIDNVRQDDKGKWYAGGLGSQKHLSRVAARSGGDLPGGPGTIHPLVTISNSETGHGGLGVRIGILAGICYNLATVEDVVARVHLGERLESGILSQEAQEADGRAIMLKVRDSIKAAFDPDGFKRLAAIANGAQNDEIKAPTTAVGNLVENLGLTDTAKDGILEYFLRDYSPTRYGIAQAVSRYAQDIDDGDDAADLEAAAGKLIRGGELIKA